MREAAALLALAVLASCVASGAEQPREHRVEGRDRSAELALVEAFEK